MIWKRGLVIADCIKFLLDVEFVISQFRDATAILKIGVASLWVLNRAALMLDAFRCFKMVEGWSKYRRGFDPNIFYFSVLCATR